MRFLKLVPRQFAPPFQVGAVLQLLPLILVPFVAIVQLCRYCFFSPAHMHDVSGKKQENESYESLPWFYCCYFLKLFRR